MTYQLYFTFTNLKGPGDLPINLQPPNWHQTGTQDSFKSGVRKSLEQALRTSVRRCACCFSASGGGCFTEIFYENTPKIGEDFHPFWRAYFSKGLGVETTNCWSHLRGLHITCSAFKRLAPGTCKMPCTTVRKIDVFSLLKVLLELRETLGEIKGRTLGMTFTRTFAYLFLNLWCLRGTIWKHPWLWGTCFFGTKSWFLQEICGCVDSILLAVSSS